MSTSEFAQLPDAGRDGVAAARPASGPRRSIRRSGSAGEPVSALDESVTAWKTAYRNYGKASAESLRLPEGDLGAMEQMANASWAVAAAWRQIAQATSLPWWTLAAVESAAQAFEAQAREWDARYQRNRPPSEGTW